MPNFGKTGKRGGNKKRQRNKAGTLRSPTQSAPEGSFINIKDYPPEHKFYVRAPEEWGYHKCGTIVGNDLLQKSYEKVEAEKATDGTMTMREVDGELWWGRIDWCGEEKLELMRSFCCEGNSPADILALDGEEWHTWMDTMVDWQIHRHIIHDTPMGICDAPAMAEEMKDGESVSIQDAWGRGE